MLRMGTYTTREKSYTIYELDEPGCYRFDIVDGDDMFNTNPASVIYSLYRKKLTYTYGDRSVYDEYSRVRSTIEMAKKESTKESMWSNGAYYTYITSVNKQQEYELKSVQKNGIITEVNMTGCGCNITLLQVAESYPALEPLNFSDYKKLTIAKKDTNADVSGPFYSLDVLKRMYDLDYIEDMDFVVVNVLNFQSRLDDYKNNPYPYRSFDTETTGTEVHLYGKDHMTGIVLGHDLRTASYFPFRHTGDFNLPMELLPVIMEVVISMQDRTTGHNVPFDEQVMKREGFTLRIKYDTLQLSIITNPVMTGRVHGLKYLTYEITHQHVLELTEIFTNPADIDFSVLPPEIIRYYACPDGVNSIIVLVDLLDKLKPWQYKLAQIECELTHSIADQEYYGIRVDVKKYEHQYHNCNYIIEKLLEAFRILTREDGNINSTQVLQNLIYNKMHCNVLTRTKTGQPSVATPAIQKLAARKAEETRDVKTNLVDLDGNIIIKAEKLANAKYPALVILAKYKEYIKLKTAFYARFERTMSTGRIFFWVNQNGAATGRQSSPMHQLPPSLKDCILSDAPDRDFWGPDFSQIELRMIAYLAGETELIELAKDPNNDIHRIIGALITGKEMWEITPEERSIGKRRNFGVVYLISKFGLAGQIFGPGYTKENVEFCGQQLDAFYKRFKRINRYILNNKKFVREHGYMETAWYRRRRNFPQIFDPNIEPRTAASIERMANNVPVQGTAADYLKLAIVTMDTYIREKGWDKLVDGFPMVRIMLSIHDELIISVLNTIPYEEIVEMITVCMERPVEGAPPFFVQPARMANWGEHSNDAVAMPIDFRNKIIKDYNETHQSIFHQSWFKVSIPSDAIQVLNSTDLSLSAKVDKYWEQVSLTFDHGDYVKEVVKTDHKKEALRNYIQSGSTAYRVDNYLDLLDDFRRAELENYMTDLIRKYGSDYKVVGEHVRHPSLTFALLDVYGKKIPKDMPHVDKIVEATRLYMEGVKIEDIVTPDSAPTVNDMKDEFISQMEPLTTFDQDGNVVYEDSTEEDEQEWSFQSFYDDDSDVVLDPSQNKPEYVWELGDALVFDTLSLTKDQINEVLAYIFKHSVDTGFYRVYLIFNNQLLDTKMKIEELNMEEANGLMTRLAERRQLCG